MQQYLPFTVLKLALDLFVKNNRLGVATVLTVYGIETISKSPSGSSVLTSVATVLTVYGIETERPLYLFHALSRLQQYLPFTVLKQYQILYSIHFLIRVATVLTVYGIETYG